MFVKRSKSGNGRYILSYTYSYRDENKKTKHVNYETIGYEDELAKLYDNPKEHFTKIGKERFKDFKPFDDIEEITISLRKRVNQNKNSSNHFNMGYAFLKEIYNELDLKSIIQVYQKQNNIKYDLNAIIQLLIYSKIIYPNTNKTTYETKDLFFENFDFTLDDFNHGLNQFVLIKEQLLSTILNKTKDTYKRDISTTYLNCINYNDTNLIDVESHHKNKPCKVNSKNSIVHLSLLFDNNGIPIDYSLSSDNKVVKGKFKKYGKTITVADCGLNATDEAIFKITKSSTLQTHPAYVWTKEHIEVHFLTSFIALIFLRLLEKRLDEKYSIEELTTSLKDFECIYMEQATYKTINANNSIIKELGIIFKKDFQFEYLRYPTIKKLLNISK